MKRKVRLSGCVVIAAVGFFSLAGCDSPPAAEASRLTSADGRMDAVVLEEGFNATTPYNYSVCVVPAGRPCGDDIAVAKVFGATRSEQAYGVDLSWRSPTQLEIRYLTANSTKSLRPEGSRAAHIGIVFRAGMANQRAAAGAMVKGG